MDKRFFSRILIPLAVVAVLVLWLLKELPATANVFAWYTLNWGVTIFLGVIGVKYLLDGIFMRSKGVIARRMTIIGAAVFLVGAFVCLTFSIAMPDQIVVPIIAIIVAAALLIGIVVTGGRKWDAGDNQSVGYKNYHQRKAEEEKAAKQAEK